MSAPTLTSSASGKTALLSIIDGYDTAMAEKEVMEQSGSTFADQRYNVATTINTLHPNKICVTVDTIFHDTPTTKTLRVSATNGHLPPFQGGQYVNVYVTIDGVTTARPFAISSSPNEAGYYDLTVKKVSDGFVSPYLVDRVSVGDQLYISGPMGGFHHNPVFHGQDLVFFAGGSGIAPARSMIQAIRDQENGNKMLVLYSNSYADDVIFQEELHQLAKEHAFLSLYETVTRAKVSGPENTGRLTQECVAEQLGTTDPDALNAKMYYICGPTPFNEHCYQLLLSLGVRSRRIKIEANGAPRHPETLTGWDASIDPDQTVSVSVSRHGEKDAMAFQARTGEPLLNSLERAGLAVENACRSGDCSLCRVKILSGEVFNAPDSKIRTSDHLYGWTHSCVAYPTSDIEILID